MDSDLKKYYRIREVAEMMDVPLSTLRFWEKEFPSIRPKRGGKGTRLYTANDIERIRMVHYLLKIKGLKIDAAKAQINNNPSGVSRQAQAVERLIKIRDELQAMLIAATRRR